MLRQLFLIPIMCSVYIWAGGHVDISPMAKMTRVWLSSESFNFVGRCASSFDDQLEWMTWNKRRCTMTRLDAAIEWMWPGNFARNQYAATSSQAESEGKELKQKTGTDRPVDQVGSCFYSGCLPLIKDETEWIRLRCRRRVKHPAVHFIFLLWLPLSCPWRNLCIWRFSNKRAVSSSAQLESKDVHLAPDCRRHFNIFLVNFGENIRQLTDGATWMKTSNCQLCVDHLISFGEEQKMCWNHLNVDAPKVMAVLLWWKWWNCFPSSKVVYLEMSVRIVAAENLIDGKQMKTTIRFGCS